jgi:hypothetical protein
MSRASRLLITPNRTPMLTDYSTLDVALFTERDRLRNGSAFQLKY